MPQFLSDLTGKQKKTVLIFICLIVLGFIYIFFHRPPKEFPLGEVVTIESGQSLQEITNSLYEKHIIYSPFFFRVHVIMQGGEKKVQAGDYLLDRAEGPADLAYRFVHGQFHLKTFKATIPEGWNIFQIGDYLEKTLLDFNKKEFLKLARSKEGYLFPDTYFISPTIKPEAVISLMQNNFNQKITSINWSTWQVDQFDLKKVIIMASILEEEARTTDSRRIVAGILWKRLSLGMPLQVDSTFSYINGKGTYDLTLDDLKIDSPYNTYLYKDLPPTPISNPGLDAINSAITPITTKYLYFLSNKSGKMYYAKTFEEHKRNKELYLNK